MKHAIALGSGAAMRAALFMLAAIAAFAAQAQTYPSKPIRIISVALPGNSGDVAMRMVIPLMGTALGQPLVMDNRTAAGGQVAAVAVKGSPADGYTFLQMAPSYVATMFLVKNVPYTHGDFSAVSRVITVPSLWVVSAAVPANTVTEFIDYAKRNPGKVAYGSTGINTAFHLIGETFAADHGLKMLHIPYTGAMAIPIGDLASDRIQLFFPSYTSVLPVIKSGKVKVLATIDRNRLKALPDVPSMFEPLPNYTLLPSFFGLMAPAGLPAPIAARFQSELRRALQDPEVNSKLEGLGSMPVGNTPAEFAEEVRGMIDTYGRVVKAIGIQPE
jgi:tripartite-type tricarboxylate transporter receptor subunit TctC